MNRDRVGSPGALRMGTIYAKCKIENPADRKRPVVLPKVLLLLGARTLEGLNLTIEPGRRRLVAAGPLPAASPTSGPPASPYPKRRRQTGARGLR